MASSVKTGLRKVSSSGTPVISSVLLSLNEVYSWVSSMPSRLHLKFPCFTVSASSKETSFSRAHSTSLASSSIPFFPIRLTFNFTTSPANISWVIKVYRLKVITVPEILNSFNCLNEINISAFFSASSMVLGVSSEGDISSVVPVCSVSFAMSVVILSLCALLVEDSSSEVNSSVSFSFSSFCSSFCSSFSFSSSPSFPFTSSFSCSFSFPSFPSFSCSLSFPSFSSSSSSSSIFVEL